MATHQMTTRSMAREVLAHPFTLHPNALRKLGVAVPVAVPALVPSRPDWIPSFAPEWDHDDYSPTSPSRVPQMVPNSFEWRLARLNYLLATEK